VILPTFIPYDFGQVQSEESICAVCGKKYKTKGGLKRHKVTKLSQNQSGEQQMSFTPSTLADIVRRALVKVKNTKVYSASLRNELNTYIFPQLEEGTEEFAQIKNL